MRDSFIQYVQIVSIIVESSFWEIGRVFVLLMIFNLQIAIQGARFLAVSKLNLNFYFFLKNILILHLAGTKVHDSNILKKIAGNQESRSLDARLVEIMCNLFCFKFHIARKLTTWENLTIQLFNVQCLLRI